MGKKIRKRRVDEFGRVNIDGKVYRPVVGIVASKYEDGRPKRVVLLRDEDSVDIEGGEEFVIFLGSVKVFGLGEGG